MTAHFTLTSQDSKQRPLDLLNSIHKLNHSQTGTKGMWRAASLVSYQTSEPPFAWSGSPLCWALWDHQPGQTGAAAAAVAVEVWQHDAHLMLCQT